MTVSPNKLQIVNQQRKIMNRTIEASIKKVNDVLSGKLEIPNYQRPYRWTENNVRLLLEDIFKSWKEDKSSYRIGSIILNITDDFRKDNDHCKGVLNIVDGQQRISTMLLLLKSLNSDVGGNLRQSLKYKHIDSKNAIRNNKSFIDFWLKENIIAKTKRPTFQNQTYQKK